MLEQSHGGRTCAAGVCNGTCAATFADCNANKQSDGCESSTNSITSCGIGQAACGAVCSTQNGAATCPAGACVITCSAGFGNCDGIVGNTGTNSNGCEVQTTTDPNNCGAGGAANAGCGVVCSNNHMSTRTCAGGACNGTCAANFADCNANKQADGCECDLTTSQCNGAACLLKNGQTCAGDAQCNSNHCCNSVCVRRQYGRDQLRRLQHGVLEQQHRGADVRGRQLQRRHATRASPTATGTSRRTAARRT